MDIKDKIIENFNLGKEEYISSKYDDALMHFATVLSLADGKEFCDYIANSIDFVGHCYKSIGYDLFEKAEQSFLNTNDSGLKSYKKAKENFKNAIKFIVKAREMFKTKDVIEKLTKEKTKLYIQRCNDVINSCNEYIERCETKIEFIK